MSATLIVVGLSTFGVMPLSIPVADMRACIEARDTLLGVKDYEALRTDLRTLGAAAVDLDRMNAVHAKYTIGLYLTAQCVPRE